VYNKVRWHPCLFQHYCCNSQTIKSVYVLINKWMGKDNATNTHTHTYTHTHTHTHWSIVQPLKIMKLCGLYKNGWSWRLSC
jgi:hypothetical protein